MLLQVVIGPMQIVVRSLRFEAQRCCEKRVYKLDMYPLVMTNSLPWKITMLLIGKPSIPMDHFP